MDVTEYLKIQADFKATNSKVRKASHVLSLVTRAVDKTVRFDNTIDIHFTNTEGDIPVSVAMKKVSFSNEPVDANDWLKPDEWQLLINDWNEKRAARDKAWESLPDELKAELINPIN